MQKKFNWLMSQNVALMMIAVFLWMLYPPIINYLIDKTSVFYVSAFSHSIGGLATLLLTYYLLFIKDKLKFSSLFLNKHFKKVLLYTGLAGIFSFSNHLLLYTALKTSVEFDVIAILIFETWPILFFLIDSKLRKEKRKTSINDYVFFGAAFTGFIILTVPNLDLADLFLFNSPMLITIALAGLGGLAMSITCYFRMKNMDVWSEISISENINLSSFKRGLLTEAGARSISGILLGIALYFSGEQIPFPESTTLILLLFVGIFILALGGVLYDLSVFNSKNAAIGALWYLMPVGAVLILAIMQGRLLNQYEAVASVLIVSSNIFLALRYPIRSSILLLFISVCSIGIWILFVPISPINDYYSLLSVSTIFFVLLATFALERATSLNHERESLLGEFKEQVVSLSESLSNSKKNNNYHLYIREIREYTFLNLHSFVRAFKSILQLRKIHDRVDNLKYSILSSLKENNQAQDQLLKLFKTGDKLQTMESDRIPPEEFVILIFLGTANIFFSLVFRPDTLSSSLFALIVSASIIYLLLIILERDKNMQIRYDIVLNIRSLIDYVQGNKKIESTQVIEEEINVVLIEKSSIQKTRTNMYWIFSIFAILFIGFGYSFLVTSLKQNYLLENSPFISTPSIKNKQIGVALLDWPSAQIKAHILTQIINQHTNLNASMVPSSSKSAFQEMDDSNGNVDIYPELWMKNNHKLIRRYIKAFGTISLGENSVNGYEGLCYTQFEKKELNLLTIAHLSSPSIAAKFDLTGKGKGDIWIGSNDWDSTRIEKRRLTAYGLNNYYNFNVFDSRILKMLLQRNNHKEIQSLFFCYYPSDIFMSKNVHFINDSEHNKETWTDIINNKDNNFPKKGTSWPPTKIKVAYRSSLFDREIELKMLLNNFSINNKDLVNMLGMIKNGMSIEKISAEWVKNNNEIILEWLTGFKLSDKTNSSANL